MASKLFTFTFTFTTQTQPLQCQTRSHLSSQNPMHGAGRPSRTSTQALPATAGSHPPPSLPPPWGAPPPGGLTILKNWWSWTHSHSPWVCGAGGEGGTAGEPRGWTRLRVQMIPSGRARGGTEASRKAIGRNKPPREDRPTIQALSQRRRREDLPCDAAAQRRACNSSCNDS